MIYIVGAACFLAGFFVMLGIAYAADKPFMKRQYKQGYRDAVEDIRDKGAYRTADGSYRYIGFYSPGKDGKK